MSQDVPRTILIIDDDADSTRLYANLLRRRGGYHTLTANSIKEAESVLQRENVDLIILDVMVPYEQGAQLSEQNSLGFIPYANEREVPVLLNSGAIGKAQTLTLQEMAAKFPNYRGFWLKTGDARSLLDTIAGILSGGRAESPHQDNS